MNKFITHEKEIVTGKRLQSAMNSVADNFRDNALEIRKADPYADHVSEEEKDKFLKDSLERAERIRHGTEKMGFWLWQPINTELTGKCVALLP